MKQVIWLVIGLALGPFSALSASAQAIGSAPERTIAALAAQPAHSDSQALSEAARLAYVDVDRVAALSMEGKAAAARLEKLRGQKEAEASQRGKHVQALQLKLAQAGPVLNDVARRRLEREFQRAQVDFQRFTEDAQEEVRDLQQELMQAFTARLFPVIGTIAKEKKLWAVFGSESVLLWHDAALDLSEEVARRLDSSAEPAR